MSRTLVRLKYEAAALTHTGLRRESNEDAFGYSTVHGVFLVGDGMGGAAAGELASSLAVEEALRVLMLPVEPAVPPPIADAISAANGAVKNRAAQSVRLYGMGTTLVGLVVRDSHIWIFNVGDSRCYRLRNGELEQVTLDHSLVEEQVRMGRMTRDEAARSPMRNVITRAVGTQAQVTPDVWNDDVLPGDLYLLCSDGLTREVDDEQIQNILAEALDLSTACARLIDTANRHGGRDNITCLLVRARAEE